MPVDKRASPFSLAGMVRWLVVLVLAGVLALSWFRIGPRPEISIASDLPGIGPSTKIAVRLTGGQRGLAGFEVALVQGDRIEALEEGRHRPRPFWAFWGPRVANEEVTVEVGSETHPDLVEGEATIRVTAERASTWLRQPEPVVQELTLPVRLKPPSIQVTSTQNYLAQGGSSVVVYRVGSTSVRDGVRISEAWFAGYPLTGGGEGAKFALFGAAHDLEDPSQIRLTAVDDVGNELAIEFLDSYLRKPLRTDTVELSESFMARVVPEILARSPTMEDRGDLLETYLAINRDLRRANATALLELASRSTHRFLWTEPFLQLPRTQSLAAFADRRTYTFEGREVDQQDHLGFDLASVRHAPVLAANRGVVLMADYLGIYGNTVVLDHGYGLMSLYAHMSSFEVEPGQEVGRGDTLGETGETGLAKGDHLHFSILLHGLPVNPLEWWDPQWIEKNVARKLGPAFKPGI